MLHSPDSPTRTRAGSSPSPSSSSPSPARSAALSPALLNSDNDSFSDTGAESAKALERIEKAIRRDGVARPHRRAARQGHRRARRDARDPQGREERRPGRRRARGRSSRSSRRTAPRRTSSRSTSRTAIRDSTTEHLREELDDVDGVTVGGFGPAYQQVNEQVESDLVKAELIAFPLLFLVSLWVFRSAVAALLPLLVGGITIVGSLLVVRGINEVVDISIFALNLITGLGLGLAIDYSLFLVSRYREELDRVRARAPRRSAVRSRPPVVRSSSRPSPSPARGSPCWSSRCASSTRWASASRSSRSWPLRCR